MIRFGNSYTDGNSNLSPEKDLQFDLGVAGKWEKLTLGLRGFDSTIYDYIEPVASNFSSGVPVGTNAPTNLFRNFTDFGISPSNLTIIPNASNTSLNYKYANINRASIYGGEFTGEYRAAKWLAFTGSLAYVRGINHTPVRYDVYTNTFVPIGGSEPLPGIYPLNSTIGVRFLDPNHAKWSFEVVTRLVHGQDQVATSLAEVATPGFGVVNLYGSYQITPHVRLFSSVENLFDRGYFETNSLAIVTPQGTIGFVKEPGINWIAGFEAKF